MTRSDARKPESDPLPYLSSIELNRDGVFKNGVSGTVTSVSYFKEYVTHFSIWLYSEPCMKVWFNAGGEADTEQTIVITYSECHFGGYRPWFLCPGLRGHYCKQRVGKLYLYSGEYACRRCHNLTYKSRMRNPRSIITSLGSLMDNQTKAANLMAHLRTVSYAGLPTKKLLKIYKLIGDNEKLSTNVSPERMRKELGMKT